MKNLPRFDAVDPCSQREFEKACYLLRVIDGCVHRPQPDGHPPGRNSQCGTVIVVEAAVAGFVSNERPACNKGERLGSTESYYGRT